MSVRGWTHLFEQDTLLVLFGRWLVLVDDARVLSTLEGLECDGGGLR